MAYFIKRAVSVFGAEVKKAGVPGDAFYETPRAAESRGAKVNN
jgi:hypothetical protein